MLRSRLMAVLAAAAATAAIAAPAAHAAISINVLDAGVTLAHPPKLHPDPSGCLLDDPTSCEVETPNHTPPHGGGGNNNGGSAGPDSYCQSYRDALGDMAGTPFGMKQLAELGC